MIIKISANLASRNLKKAQNAREKLFYKPQQIPISLFDLAKQICCYVQFRILLKTIAALPLPWWGLAWSLEKAGCQRQAVECPCARVLLLISPLKLSDKTKEDIILEN